LDNFKTNEAVNHEKYKEMGIMENKGNFIRKGTFRNAITLLNISF
jgi:hypothetical protein